MVIVSLERFSCLCLLTSDVSQREQQLLPFKFIPVLEEQDRDDKAFSLVCFLRHLFSGALHIHHNSSPPCHFYGSVSLFLLFRHGHVNLLCHSQHSPSSIWAPSSLCMVLDSAVTIKKVISPTKCKTLQLLLLLFLFPLTTKTSLD